MKSITSGDMREMIIITRKMAGPSWRGYTGGYRILIRGSVIGFSRLKINLMYLRAK
jgi:hypothetical protein